MKKYSFKIAGKRIGFGTLLAVVPATLYWLYAKGKIDAGDVQFILAVIGILTGGAVGSAVADFSAYKDGQK